MAEETKKQTTEEKKPEVAKAEEKPKQESTEKPKDVEQKPQKKGKVDITKKKDEAVVNARSLPISTKYAIGICKFIKGKTTEQALKDLEQVTRQKKAVPLRGELPHRKGKIMSGRYPLKASQHFIKLVKSLAANAAMNNMEVENAIITEASANLAHRPYHRFGRAKFKRTHVTLKLKEKTGKKEKKK